MLQTQSLQTSKADLLGGQNPGFGKNSGSSKPSDTGGASFGDILANVGKSTSAQSSKPERTDNRNDVKADGTDRSRSDDRSAVSGQRDDKAVKNGDDQKSAENAEDTSQDSAVSKEVVEAAAGAGLAAMMNIVTVQEADVQAVSEAGAAFAVNADQPVIMQVTEEAPDETVVTDGIARQAQNVQQTATQEAVETPEIQQGQQPKAVQTQQAQVQNVDAAVDAKQNAASQSIQNAGNAEPSARGEQQYSGQTQQQADVNTGAENRGSGSETEYSPAGGSDDGVTVKREDVQTQAAARKNANEADSADEAAVQPQTTTAAAREITVKVSDGATLTQQLPKDVGNAIAQQLSEGAQEFNITLNPENLGKISIKLILDNGRVTVLMNASEESTQKMLSMNAGVIKQIIEESTGQEAHVEVQDAEEPEARGQRENGERQQQEGDPSSEGQSREEDGGSNENSTASFIQQLRLGLVGNENEEAV